MARTRTRKLMQEGGGKVDWPPAWLDTHPAADRFPMMDDDSFAGLRASILESGQQEPVRLTPDKQIVDGRNRYRVCMLEGIEPRLEVYEENGTPWIERVRIWNLARRHLTASQRAANIRLSDAKLTGEQVALKAGCSQPQVARVDAGAEFLVEEGTAKSLTAAYAMIAYGQVKEGELRRRKQEQEKRKKIEHSDKLHSARMERASRELQKLVDDTPKKEREAFVDGLRAASSIVSRFNVGGLDLEKLVSWVTQEELDEDEA